MSNLAAASVQSATYATERTKQETNELGSSANTTAAETHDDFQSKVDAAANQARVKKEEAVAEGKADVEQAKATTASYIDQARDLVGAALGKAQNYVSAGQERLGATTTHSTAHVRSTGSEGPHQGGFTEVLTGAAVTALQTTKGVLATAQAQLAATGQSAHTTKPQTPRPTSPSYTDAANQHAKKAKEAIQPHLDASKHSVPDSTGPSAPSISSTAATVGSNTSTEATSASSQITSPSTITYPKEPKMEAHHVTTEGGAAPPEKVDDKAVNKLADELTSTKVTDTTFATSTH